MLIGGLGTPEIIIIALVVLLLFGGKKISLEERTEIVRWAEGVVAKVS